MATTDKDTIKSWFETGDIPNQAQFAAWIDSFFHKDEKIQITSIQGLVAILNAKAETEMVTGLFAKARIVPIDDFIIFKRGTTTPDALEPTDLVKGIVEGIWIFAIYNGGDKTLLENYTILQSQEF